MTVAKRAGSLLCLSLFLFLQVLAAVPQLHQHLHHDAAQADHQCAVTLLSHGNVHHASNEISLITAPSQVIEIPAQVVLAPVIADYLLLPGRAPPVSC